MAAATMPLTLGASEKTRAINPWVIAITVTLATFMELLDTAIANVFFLTSPVAWLPATTRAHGSSPVTWLRTR